MEEEMKQLFELLHDLTEYADEHTTEKQRQVKTGDYIIRIVDETTIYGEVLDPKEAFKYELLTEEERTIFVFGAELYQESCMTNYRLCRCYSSVDPYMAFCGELGDVHIFNMVALISYDVFCLARKLNWPNLCDLPEEALVTILTLTENIR